METSHAKSSLKVCRRGDPLTCQRIWDVIKEIRIERKLATTKDNVVQEYCKKYNVESKYVEEQLKLFVEDKLILQKTIAVAKGSNEGVEQNIFVIPLDVPEVSQTETYENVMPDLMILQEYQDDPIVPKASQTKTYEQVMIEWISEKSLTLVSLSEKIASLQKDIDSKKQQIDTQELLINTQEQLIKSQQKENEAQRESHASAIRILMENHANTIAKIKTKVWCSNRCGSERNYHCCGYVSYCNTICQQEHWGKGGHKKYCRRARE